MKQLLRSITCPCVVVSLLFATQLYSQVGIGTTTPDSGTILDITSSDKAILVPRVNILNLGTIAPIVGSSTESLLVYNTNTTTGPGYFYWDGTQWRSLSGDDWELLGNDGTDADINFVGTTDNEALTFRTNDTQRFRVANDFQVLAMGNGTRIRPFYSWDSERTMGFWKPGANQMNMSIEGYDFFNANANNSGGSELEWTFNPIGDDINLRVETDNQENALFVDGSSDNVGMGTNSPNGSAQLELADINRGLLINRVALTATDVAAPVVAPTSGLLVFNTASASSGSTEVLPGFYYWDDGEWIAMGGTGGRDWSLLGNAGTNSSTNFLGTTDNTSLSFRTNDVQRMQIADAGTVGIGSNPYNNAALRVNNPAQPYGVISETNGTGVALYGSDTGTGFGVFGTSANNHGVYGTTAFTGSSFLIGGIIGWGTGANGANGVLAVSDAIGTTRQNMGIRAVSGSTTSISSASSLHYNVGVNSNATDLGLYVLTEKTSGDREAARFQTNYTGSAIDADNRDPRAMLAGFTNSSYVGGSSMYYGGFFYSGGSSSNYSYAYAGARYGSTQYKIIGNGTVSTIVDGATNGDPKKIMFAPEAPEVLFEDYGTGTLQNGVANVTIDPILSNNIVVSEQHPLKVFIQLEGDCNGVYVTNKTQSGFTVTELQGGTSSVPFSWHIVANRKDSEGTTSEARSLYTDLRFPNAPEAILPNNNREDGIQENNTVLFENTNR
ncbi:hypothetical protein [Altibacter sp. HG106]|uniref:hypothetical protein n=1 Tax=Altibacter sp. HG106 TaxID=3023937 RepID=UPI002350D800|nr:hypothetical protein [Altibacter sp. HG106]MDC7995898.1 hypothetical protein [Altibacter sp. HG106]